MRNVQVHSGTDFEITSFAGDHFYVQDRKQAPVVVAAIVKHAARVREGTIPSPPPKAAPEPTFLDGESETEARTHARMHARTQASEPAGKSPNTHVMRLAPSPSSPFPFRFRFPFLLQMTWCARSTYLTSFRMTIRRGSPHQRRASTSGRKSAYGRGSNHLHK